MDKQYTKSTYVKLGNGTFFLEPNTSLDTPKDFKEYISHEDDNIFMVANRFYQDTTMWYPIALFSGVIDPLNIPIGTILLLPIYDDKNPEDIFI